MIAQIISKTGVHKDRLIMSGVIAALAMALGTLIPILYRMYFDKTQYYTLVQPVEVQNSTVKQCEDVILVMRRTALVDTHGVFRYELSKMEGEGSQAVAHFEQDEVVIEKGFQVVYKHLPVPCTAPVGTYFVSGLVEYNVDRALRTYNFYTYKFEVVE